MDNALVSIIIPIYNVSKYLDTCIQSACSQTYTNLEIILVDDGSPDDCPVKCDSWAQRDSRIKVIHKKNGGLSDARNAGLEVATGKYIYFFDSDDTIKPHLIETAVAHMEKGMDMVSICYDIVFPDGGTKTVIHELGEFDLSDPQSRVDFILLRLLIGKIGWGAWSRMYSMELIQKYKLRFADNRLIFAEDLYFCLCYCAHAKHIKSISGNFYNYFQRTDSIMGQNTTKLNVGRMNELAKAVYKHFQEWHDCGGLMDAFPLIHYLIISNVMDSAMRRLSLPAKEFRSIILEDIEDQTFFISQIKRLPQYRSYLNQIFTGSQAAERLSYVKYFLDENYTALRVRNRLIYQFSELMDRNTKQMKDIRNQYRELSRCSKRVFLLGTEEFGNIRDSLITESSISFLGQALPEYAIHEVMRKQWTMHKAFLKKSIKKNDLIVFAGGGNFGDTYPAAQNFRAELIRLWPENPKIVFPQTIDFSNSEQGQKMLAEAKRTYTRENNVTLFAREQESFAFAQAHFSCDCYAAPDIVLSLEVPQGTARKDRILMCFRRNSDKSLPEKTVSKIESLCKSTGLTAEHTDLQLDYNIDKEKRKDIIEEKLDLWRQSKMVVTDRLHGMIFAAITGTPCIAFNNCNHKVSGTYEWIKYLPYIRLAETASDLDRFLPELLAIKNCHYDNTPLLPYFDKIAEVILR